MRKILLAFIMIVSPFAATADEVEHYSAEKIKDEAHAIETLNNKTSEISTILEKEKLGDIDLERIHEISYTLEAATDEIAKNKNVDELDEAVQAIHFASEKHEEKKTREWFTKLETASGKIDQGETLAIDANKTEYEIVIKDHKFSPETIKVPTGKKIKLRVHNQDPTPEEFESHDMNREKIINGNKKATIYVGPLEPGKYHYFGEFNMETANAYIIAE